ncbi:hypothetical protein SCHPADRAFT_895534 [Schizopora paradoxa]|uniref:Uncharacterized protein n=1 Tax=Schizopora paradoxa TaxID=27342 RepID=A0A0H2R3C6_9AGAM|nr:hypothetical protein SCHPADRAFT_895534 [Schizopora paradoxa]
MSLTKAATAQFTNSRRRRRRRSRQLYALDVFIIALSHLGGVEWSLESSTVTSGPSIARTRRDEREGWMDGLGMVAYRPVSGLEEPGHLNDSKNRFPHSPMSIRPKKDEQDFPPTQQQTKEPATEVSWEEGTTSLGTRIYENTHLRSLNREDRSAATADLFQRCTELLSVGISVDEVDRGRQPRTDQSETKRSGEPPTRTQPHFIIAPAENRPALGDDGFETPSHALMG